MTPLAALKPAVDDAVFVSLLTEYRDAIVASGQRCFAFSATDGVVDERRFEYELLQACRALPGGLPGALLVIITDATSPDPAPEASETAVGEATEAAVAPIAPSEYPTATRPPERPAEPAAKALPGATADPFAHPSEVDHLPALLAETGFGLRRDGAAWLLTASDGTVIGRGGLVEITRLARKFGRAEA